jgi:PmbA protein
MTDKNLLFIEQVIDKTKKQGANVVEVMMGDSASTSADIRNGKIDQFERSESKGFGIRAIAGDRQAVVYSSDFSDMAVDTLISKLGSMLKVLPADPYIAYNSKDFVKNIIDIDKFDSFEPTPQQLIDIATECAESAMSVKGVTNSDGANCSHSRGKTYIVSSEGFAHSYESTSSAISASAIAGTENGMETDYDYDSKAYFSDLLTPQEIGKKAGERAVEKLNPVKIKSGKLPIIFDPRVSNGYLYILASAINGSAIARGTSFLKDKMGEDLFPKGFNVYDDPHILRGPRSKPFDGEGHENNKLTIIEDGRLKQWILDLSTAKRLGLTTNGRAARGMASIPNPSCTNLYFAPGKISPNDLIKSVKKGIYVNDLIGSGANIVSGDYSEGASGFMIEDGELTFPVSEITIAGKFLDMFKNMTLANDLTHKYGIDSPTMMIDGMTIAGT